MRTSCLFTAFRFALIGTFLLATSGRGSAEEFPEIINTQRPGEHPPTPAEAVAAITVPPGFKVTLFAGEPDVAQPIAVDFDDRGRLIVAECYTFDGRGFDGKHRDRVLFFRDEDGDGRFDERKVFWDGGRALTSVAWGFDGLWVLNAGTLSHIPDANRDDVPDAEPTVHLDGFSLETEHNVVNGLLWGPDGWLYGRHGILATSKPGVPGTPDAERLPLNCGIWRYHPTRHVFEIVCRGTTNPWGMDYDEHGQFFFTNNVTGHAWHVIPGAHYERMYGEDFNPHLYELIGQHAGHYHWDTTGQWQASREGANGADELGGGHSHCGGMIYLGDNWPTEYRGGLFMCNTHGRRLNHDVPVRKDSGYVLKRAPDLFFANQPWFRGVSLAYGPDGGVYVTDWSDLGECHDHDGVHRTSGRIYKVTYGTPKPLSGNFDITKLSDDQLVDLQDHPNAWHARRARRLLHERKAGGPVLAVRSAQLKKDLFADLPSATRLRRLWALLAIGFDDDMERDKTLGRLLTDPDEHLRAWAIKLLSEQRPFDLIFGSSEVSDPIVGIRLAELASQEPSAFVRLHFASAMQRLPARPDMGMLSRDEIGGFGVRQATVRLNESRWQIAEALARRTEDANDHNLPLMIWYGLEPLVPTAPDRAIRLAETTPIPLLRRHVARRLASSGDSNLQALPKLIQLVARLESPAARGDVLVGIAAALRGVRKMDPPPGWDALRDDLVRSTEPLVAEPAKELAIVFGDGRAMDDLKKLASDVQAAPTARRDALDVLIRSGESRLAPLLHGLVTDRATAATAARGLAAVGDDETPSILLKRFWSIPAEARPNVVSTLTVRESWALALLDEVEKDEVPKHLVTAADARQMAALGSEQVSKRLGEVWGTIRVTPETVRSDIERLRGELTPDVLASADLRNGRGLFNRLCASCHKLYGEGTAIGPDITGSNRSSLDYLLENVVDPSATVPEAFRSSVVLLADGRVLAGVVTGRSENRLTLQTATEKLTFDAADVEEVRVSEQSLMPNGLLDRLSAEETRDLFAYISSRAQVPLEDESTP